MFPNILSQLLFFLVLELTNAEPFSTWKKMDPDGSRLITYSPFGDNETSWSLIQCAALVSVKYPVKGEALKFDASESRCQALRYDQCPMQAIVLDQDSSSLLIKDKPKKEDNFDPPKSTHLIQL